MPEKKPAASLHLEPEPVYERLDPAAVRLFRDDTGHLRLVIEGDRCYVAARVLRTFPLSDPDHYLAFLDDKERLIGLIPDPGELDEESQRQARRELERRYFLPTVHRVREAREEFGALYCDVETDQGRRQFVTRGVRDTLVELGDGQLLMSDVDGNRYRVADWRLLDPRSRRLLERLV
jgi:hypothetical protein